MKSIMATALVVILSACALPNTNVRVGSVRPALTVKGAPDSSVLYVDGISAGVAAQFDGVNKVLNLEEGSHRVEIRIGEQVLYKATIYISSGENRVLDVAGARQ
jgi:hypothetical protein